MIENVLTSNFYSSPQEEIESITRYFYSHLTMLPPETFDKLSQLGKNIVSDSFKSDSLLDSPSLADRLSAMFPKSTEEKMVSLVQFYRECETIEDMSSKLVSNLKAYNCVIDNTDGVHGLGCSLLSTWVVTVDRVLNTEQTFLSAVRKCFTLFLEGNYSEFLSKLRETVFSMDREDLNVIELQTHYLEIHKGLKEMIPL